VLERELPKLQAEGFELVTISELLTRPLNRSGGMHSNIVMIDTHEK
jgi:polysaccharide deacetylase 2 family uncharacterized protein YibQ